MKKKKIVTVIGARPQFIKAWPVSIELRKYFQEVVVHTGQHYDAEMSDIFFKELRIVKPDYHLRVGSGSHAEQTANIMIHLEKILLGEEPDAVLIYGDTNSTIAGALTAAKLNIPVIHIEAGLRSYNFEMPEEINRVATDSIAKYLFVPTKTSLNNLKHHDKRQKIYLSGDVMLDAAYKGLAIAKKKSKILDSHGLNSKKYFLMTVHRASNTDDRHRLTRIIKTALDINGQIVFPAHPRTIKMLEKFNLLNSLVESQNVQLISPVGYLDMLMLESNAKKIITDSGGVQKEAYFLKVPCVTLREETEWVETLIGGKNILVGSNPAKIRKAVNYPDSKSGWQDFYGKGDAAEKIAKTLKKELQNAQKKR